MFVVGLTGGIGSGKTVVSDHLGHLGVPIIDTDVIAREVVNPEQPALIALVDYFGEDILNQDGTLNRGELRQRAFASDANKAKLDSITHPAIRVATQKQISQAQYDYCVVVIPLLTADSAFSKLLNRILVVTADHETKIQRVGVRSGLNRDEVERIMASQLSDAERLDFADDVIENNGSLTDARLAAEKVHAKYLALATSQS